MRRRDVSASLRAAVRLAPTFLIAPSCSCEAPAASSAPAAICSIARRNSSAAEDASVRPLASSSVAAATLSATLSCCNALPLPAARAARAATAGFTATSAADGRLIADAFLPPAGGILEVFIRAIAVSQPTGKLCSIWHSSEVSVRLSMV